MEAEFHGKYQHPKIILNTPELAELYYYSKNLNDKRLKFQQLDQQLFQINQLIKSSNLTKEEIKTLEKQIPFLRNLLQGITCEIEEVESHVQRLRHFLAQMDQI
ncbi:MAG: hypothetical protein HWD61_08600 [Parachlamydiaceae bacterium]|nr:MAG: hypothetical protein HWD61_08600 [Parachlamydiaceae bacterium]